MATPPVTYTITSTHGTTASISTTIVTGAVSAIPSDHGIPVNARHRACLDCHQTGDHGAPVVPADHGGRTDDQCQLCHQPAQAGRINS
jgi:hypothetical protein